MIKIFVTGATGFIGERLCHRLAREGYFVHALYRNKSKTGKLQHPNILLFKGNIQDAEKIKTAMKDCDYVFHMAAIAQVWAKPKERFHDINYKATQIIFELAKKLGVKRVIFTSTAGVIGPSDNGKVDEKTERKVDFFSEYERTKHLAETVAKTYVEQGLDIVIVNPTRVYGPGELSVSNSVTKMIWQYVEGRFRFLPGNGKSIGNYVYVDDVVQGHLLALKHGNSGERYILGGSNVSYEAFFHQLAEISNKKYRMIRLPLALMIVIAYMMLIWTKITGLKPLITPGWVKKFNHNWEVSSDKALKELKYNPLSLKEGFIKTMEWLNQKNAKNPYAI